MPIQTGWSADDKKLIAIQFVSPWTGHDALKMINDCVQLIESVPHVVDIVIDFRDALTQIPTHYLPVIQRMNELSWIKRGIVVVVGAPYFIRALSTIAQGIAPDAFKDAHFVETMEAAENLITERKQNRA